MQLDRRFPMVALAGLCALNAQTGTKDYLAKRFTGYHTRIFGLGNLLLLPFATKEQGDQDDVKDWRLIMAEVAAFVHANGSAEDEQAMARLNAASEKLLWTRQRSWDAFVQKSFLKAPPTGLAKDDPRRLDFTRLDLAGLILDDNDLGNERKALGAILQASDPSTRSRFLPGKRSDALDLINRAALTLDLTIAKYHNDLIKAKAAKPR